MPICHAQAGEVTVGLLLKFRRDLYGCASVVAIISVINSSIKSGLIAGFWYIITVILFRAFFESDSDDTLK